MYFGTSDINPDWQVGGGISIGSNGVPVINISAGAGSPGSCPTCSGAKAVSNLPLIILAIAVAVLVIR